MPPTSCYALVLNIMRRVMYVSFIRPLLEYADVVWDNCSNALKNDVEAVQIEAARICTGATKFCNIQKILQDLKWESLAERRKKHRLILFYKMTNSLTPSYLSTILPQNEPTYNLRNMRSVPSRTQAHNTSFLPSTIRDWNSLPLHIRQSTSLSTFKQSLNSTLGKSSPLFNIGSRKGQIFHTRLRLGCSALNYDLHRRSLVESPLCQCGAIETVDHFLLRCPNYQHLRTQYLNNNNLPCPLTTSNLLNGNDRLTLEQNKHLIVEVQKFILTSKRFNT